MTILALTLSFVTVAVAAVHLLWAVGYWFPFSNEEKLVAAVVGLRGATRMPGAIPCALVTVVLLFAAAVPWWPQGWLRLAGLGFFAGAFALRGAAGFTRPWRRIARQEPFARLDRRLYSPLSLALALGYLVLLLAAVWRG